jgi:hypothetical protein
MYKSFNFCFRIYGFYDKMKSVKNQNQSASAIILHIFPKIFCPKGMKERV